MDDKSFRAVDLQAEKEGWTLADLDEELDEMERLIEEGNRILGLPPISQMESASSSRR